MLIQGIAVCSGSHLHNHGYVNWIYGQFKFLDSTIFILLNLRCLLYKFLRPSGWKGKIVFLEWMNRWDNLEKSEYPENTEVLEILVLGQGNRRIHCRSLFLPVVCWIVSQRKNKLQYTQRNFESLDIFACCCLLSPGRKWTFMSQSPQLCVLHLNMTMGYCRKEFASNGLENIWNKPELGWFYLSLVWVGERENFSQ